MAYRIFGCGIKAEEHGYNKNNRKHSINSGSKKRIIVALESVVVLPK